MFLIDLAIFTIVFFVLYIIRPSDYFSVKFTAKDLFRQYVLPIVCIFGFRIAFSTYKQALPQDIVKALAKLLEADVSGGALYVLLVKLVPAFYQVSVLRAGALVFVNFAMTLAARFVYYSLYRIVNPKTEQNDLIEPINDIQRVARQFDIPGEVEKITQMNAGYINRTYKVETRSADNQTYTYTLQRINTNVFPDVDALMYNFQLTTNHLKDKLFLPGRGKKGSIQQAEKTKKGELFLCDDTGCWRMMTHFTGVYSLDIPDSPQTFYHAGKAFGSFVREMSDIPADQIKVVIKNFHNTYSRYEDLEKAVTADPVGRVKDVLPEIEFIRARKEKFSLITEALESGKIPTRICHNDCNLNNILFDNETHLPVAIIDLDTVMPSTPLYDYGDSMRIGTNTAKDDEKDLSKVSCDLNLYESYARGYLEACGRMLTKEELSLLPYASLIITAEDGIRFLMDHINGDTYYHIFYSGQNLDRSRTQLKLLNDMEKKLPEIKEILKKIYKEQGLETGI